MNFLKKGSYLWKLYVLSKFHFEEKNEEFESCIVGVRFLIWSISKTDSELRKLELKWNFNYTVPRTICPESIRKKAQHKKRRYTATLKV